MASQPLSIDATIVTRHPPDVDRNAFIVAICAVPLGREGKEDLGHHLTDFLAWKTLYASSSANPNNQIWLAQTNLATALQKHGHHHTGRDISAAATDDTHPVVVESNPQALVGRFMKALAQKVGATHDHNDALVIILCGLTSLEQDLFIVDGEDYVATITSTCIRACIGENVHVTLITPSVTSAGWQVNPSLMSYAQTRADKIEFLARQCGAVFSQDVVAPFYSEDSPIFKSKVDGSFAIPVMKSPELKATEADLNAMIYAKLSGRFVAHPEDHSFCFEGDNDPWNLIGARTGIPLAKLARNWGRLSTIDAVCSSDDHYHFLGNAFGGNRQSQLRHIEHMFKHGLSSAGFRSVSKDQNLPHFDQLKMAAQNDEAKCHILFNVLEHRMTTMVLGDMVPRALSWPVRPAVRCRDWNEGVWTGRTQSYDKKLSTEAWAHCLKQVCPVGMPYGRHIGQLKGLFIPLSGPTRYIAAIMAARCSSGQQLSDCADGIRDLFNEIKAHQTKLLCTDPEVQELSSVWADCCRSETEAPTNLSPLASTFVPSTRLDHSMAQVAIQPPSPVKQIANTEIIEPAFEISESHTPHDHQAMAAVTRDGLHDQLQGNKDGLQGIKQESESVVGEDTSTEAHTSHAQSAILDDEKLSSEDDESHLPPHLRTRPFEFPRPTAPHSRVPFAPTTPDEHDWNAVESMTTEQQQPPAPASPLERRSTLPPLKRRNTPPHLRSAVTPESIPSIRYR